MRPSPPHLGPVREGDGRGGVAEERIDVNAGVARLAQDRRDAHEGVLKVHRRVALGREHALVREHVVVQAVLRGGAAAGGI